MTEPLIITVHTSASTDEVRTALTDSATVTQWLADHAEIDLPTRYEFWGRSIPEGDEPHQTLIETNERSLTFTWLLGGESTTTSIAFEAEENGTAITLTQSHFDVNDMMTGANIRGVLGTFWSLALANLVDFLEGREITARADFTSSDLRATVDIDASLDDVYDSLISSEKVSAWFGIPIEIEPHVNGRFAMGGIEGNPHPAIIIDLVPNERVSVDWGPGGIATWELEDSGGKTSLTLVSSGFDENHPPYSGWLGNLSGLAELRRFHEIQNWSPISVPA